MRCDFCGGRGQIDSGVEPVYAQTPEEVREGFQKILESAKDSPALAVLLAAYCLGCQEKSKYDLSLPTDEARRVMQTQGGNFQAAFKDFVQALQRGGWIK
jgi:hypothetical protein